MVNRRETLHETLTILWKITNKTRNMDNFLNRNQNIRHSWNMDNSLKNRKKKTPKKTWPFMKLGQCFEQPQAKNETFVRHEQLNIDRSTAEVKIMQSNHIREPYITEVCFTFMLFSFCLHHKTPSSTPRHWVFCSLQWEHVTLAGYALDNNTFPAWLLNGYTFLQV